MNGIRRVLAMAAPVWLIALTTTASSAPADRRGPLSDFWPKVRHDWAQRLTSLNHGATQTFIWVPIIWDGPDDRVFAGLIDRLRVRERHNWLRAGATEHRWREFDGRRLSRLPFMRQNNIVIGTPMENGFVSRALEPTPLRVGPGRIEIAGRAIRGDNLLLIAIAPNPVHPSSYSLVITGTSERALLGADGVAYGETDFIVYRGARVVERGYFDWSDGAPRTDRVLRSQSYTTHLTWRVTPTRHARIHHDPVAIPEAVLAPFGRRFDADIETTAVFLGMPSVAIPTIDLYVYDSPDAKIDETSDPRLSHVDPADNSLHVVLSPDGGPPDPSLAALVLLAGIGPDALPGLRQALSLACRETFQGIPLAVWASRSTRDAGWLPIDRLFYRDPDDLESGDLDLLDAAAFLRDLVAREGIAKVTEYYRSTRREDLMERFRTLFGDTLASAERRWLRAIRPDAIQRAAGDRHADPTAMQVMESANFIAAREAFRSRDDRMAEELLRRLPATPASRVLLARLSLRAGRFGQAEQLAGEVIADAAAGADDRAWARLTLGRALALTGRRVAAIAELRHDDIGAGPGQVSILAEYWLSTMGMPLNQRAAHEVAMNQAQVELTNWNWDTAEERLKVVLAADPLNRKAHAILGQVYLSKYTYWHDFALLDRELFAGVSDADPEMYRSLADKGRREIEIASRIPAGGDETLEGGPSPGDVEGLEDPAMRHLLLGKARVLEGSLDAAVTEFEEALVRRDVTRDVAALCHLYIGRIAAQQGDATRARTHFESILSLRAGEKVTSLARREITKLRTPDVVSP